MDDNGKAIDQSHFVGNFLGGNSALEGFNNLQSFDAQKIPPEAHFIQSSNHS
jgi:hypothetical protein